MIRIATPFLLAVVVAHAPIAAALAATPCDHIQNPYEFNKCLASQSPVRGKARATAPQPEGATASGGNRLRTVRRGGRVSSVVYLGGSAVQRASGGRKRITFDVRSR